MWWPVGGRAGRLSYWEVERRSKLSWPWAAEEHTFTVIALAPDSWMLLLHI